MLAFVIIDLFENSCYVIPMCCVRPTVSDINLKRYINNNEVTHLIFI